MTKHKKLLVEIYALENKINELESETPTLINNEELSQSKLKLESESTTLINNDKLESLHGSRFTRIDNFKKMSIDYIPVNLRPLVNN